MYSDRRSRTIHLAVVVSTLLHVGFLFLASRLRTTDEYYPDLHEVAFMDITYRPEVARVMARAAPAAPGPQVPDALADAPMYAPAVVPEIDLSATMERDRSDARIDLDGFELDRGDGLDVIRLGGEGTGKTTEEILAQPPQVSLARGLDRSGSGAAGLRGTPGVRPPEAQLRIEHRPLAQAPATRLPELPAAELPQVAAAPSTGPGFTVAGPISQRPITRRVLPRYPRWALDRRISGEVVIRLWVAPNGCVKGTPTVENSSGYPDLDQVVVSALRNWEFEPLGPGVAAEDQWGIITFRFRLS